jgi:hypothetical protein
MNWRKLQDRPALQQYGLTLLLVICALAIRLALCPVIADRAPYLFFFLVVAAVSRLWGLGPGLFATLFGRVGDLVFPPRTTILIHFLAAARWHHPDLLLCSCNRHKFSAPSQLKRIKTRKEIGPDEASAEPEMKPSKRIKRLTHISYARDKQGRYWWGETCDPTKRPAHFHGPFQTGRG